MIKVYRDDIGRPVLVGECALDPAKYKPGQRIGIPYVARHLDDDGTVFRHNWFEFGLVGDPVDKTTALVIKLRCGDDERHLPGWRPLEDE